MTAERNTSYSFLLLMSLDYKFMTIFEENIEDANIWHVPSHIARNTHCKFSPYLSNSFKISHSRHLVNGKSSYILHSSLKQHDLRSIMRSYAEILNLVLDISSYLTENIISTAKTCTCILMWGSLIYQIFNKFLTNLSKVSSTKFHENPSGGSSFTPWRQWDGQTEMMRIMVAFCNYVANLPKKRTMAHSRIAGQ